jgi:hypothetical protein
MQQVHAFGRHGGVTDGFRVARGLKAKINVE